MTKIKDIICWMNEKFPPETACDWDNSGLLVGSDEGETESVVIALDLSSKTIDIAAANSSKLIITHHPVIFGGIKSVTSNDPTGKMIIDLVRNGTSCFAAHTNLDANHDYSNGYLAKILDAENVNVIPEAFCGVSCEIPETTLDSFINKLVSVLDSSGAITINDRNNKVRRLFVQGGSFDEDIIPKLIEEGIDTVVSGEIKHHITVLLEEYGINTVIAGHNATERVFMTYLAEQMQKSFPDLRIFVNKGNESSNI